MSKRKTHRFRLEEAGSHVLEIEADGKWRDVIVRLEGNEIGSVKDLQRERGSMTELPMPDGSTLTLALSTRLRGHEIRAYRDGKPLPDTAWRLRVHLRRAPITAIVIAVFLGGLAGLRFAHVFGPQQLGRGPSVLAAAAAAFLALAALVAFAPRRVLYRVALPLGALAAAGLLGSGLAHGLASSLASIVMMFVFDISHAGDAFATLRGARHRPRWFNPRRVVTLFATLGLLGAIFAKVIPYAFEYMKISKETGAERHVKRLARRAQQYRDEHGTYPIGNVGPTPPLGACCAGGDATRFKCMPDMSLWEDPLWHELHFTIDDPDYFAYEYESDGEHFTARAHVDLDCDETYKVYEMTDRDREVRTVGSD